MKASYTKQMLVVFSLTGILLSHFFLFAPTTLYIGNADEFSLSLGNILSHFMRPAVFCGAALMLVGAVLPSESRIRYCVLLASLSILFWIQSNLLTWDYGALDGRSIDWTQDRWRGWVDLGIWVSVIAATLWFSERLLKPVIATSVTIFGLQLILIAFTVATNWSNHFTRPEHRTSDALVENYRFSSKMNVVHLIIDGFQSDVFNEIINEGDEGRGFLSRLDGFVFFQEHLGVFPYTHMTIPAMLTGEIYRNHVSIETFRDETLGGKTFLNAAYDAGYEVDIASPLPMYHWYTRGKYTNAYNMSTKRHLAGSERDLSDVVKLLDLTLFRSAPHLLKRLVYNGQKWLLQPIFYSSNPTNLHFFFAHNEYLKNLEVQMSVTRSAPVYKLIHVMLSHTPFVAGENCTYAGKVLPVARVTVKNQARCGLRSAIRMLERMKELGIYDDALIILMGDHGAWVPPAGLQPHTLPDGRRKTVDPIVAAMALPLLAIKRPGASGELQVSEVPSSLVDTAATIASVLDFDVTFPGRSVFDLRPGQPRLRQYHYYRYSRSELRADYLKPVQEFVIDGRVLESSAWSTGSLFLPEGVVQQQ